MSSLPDATRDATREAIREANIEALARRLPELAALLRAAAAGMATDGGAEGVATGGATGGGVRPGIELSISPKGFLLARLGGLCLNSGYDPIGEARRLAASLPPEADTAIVFGFGLGYAAEAALGSLGRVLVCEADPEILAACLGGRDLRPLLADERLGFIVGGEPEAVIAALDEIGARHIGILGLKAVEAAFSSWYARARAACDRFTAKEGINENTLRRFGKLWVRNLARNLPLIGELPGTASLEGLFAGLPAIVLAAGPSLDLILPRLAELRENALLVCVDTALRSVLKAGLEPDFLLVVDPQYWNWRHLEGLAAPSSILVSESAAWPAVFRFPCRAAFLCSSLFPLGKAIEEGVGEKGKLGAGGSVATTAWDFARVLGASTVYMAGLDLGFPRGETHARASLFEQRALASGRRLAPAETSQTAALFSGGGLWAASNSGGSIRTDKRMSLYSWWFESRLARSEAPATLNLSAEGLAIPGMAPASAEEILALPGCRPEIDARLARAASIRMGEAGRRAVAQGLSFLRAELEKAEAAASLAESEARSARADIASGRDPSPRLELLDRIDAELLSGKAGDVIGFLLPPLAEILGTQARDLGESLALSESLYSKVASSARYHLEKLGGRRRESGMEAL